jgi:hypothetical protein
LNCTPGEHNEKARAKDIRSRFKSSSMQAMKNDREQDA